MELLIKSLQKEISKLKQQLRRSSTISIRRDGSVVKIVNSGTQTMKMLMNSDDNEDGDKSTEDMKNTLLQQNGLSSLGDAMQLSGTVRHNSHGLFTRLLKLNEKNKEHEADDDDDNDDDVDDDDDDDVNFGRFEQVLRLKQENAVLKHRILDLEQSTEKKEREDENKFALGENILSEDKGLLSRIKELEEQLRVSESSRERLERMQRKRSKRRAANRISRRSLLALRAAEKETKSAKELYSTARSKLRKTNSPLLHEAMLTAKAVGKMRRLTSSPESTLPSVSESLSPSTPPRGGWNRRRSSSNCDTPES